MMENADALDLSKENIQPLKKGRNTAQLGLALQAQSDATLHQMLAKKQEWYEMQIRTYEGSDPLGLWCDYISWVEQSYPKHGPEGNLTTLLTKCFQAFKDEDKYRNDVRFVRLWIKYIEMQNDSKRVELYHLLHSQGIGQRCAEFYRCWAGEYECFDDWKQAEKIYQLGFASAAQPAEELTASFERFTASYVFNHRNMNNETHDDDHENHFQSDQRLPMAALKPVGKKSSAPNVRVGTNVRSQLPGVLPAMQGSSGRSIPSSRTFGVRGNNTAPVSVYQQRGDTDVEDSHIPHGVTSAVPIPQSLNKENIVSAGPWTGQGLGPRKHQTAGHSFIPRPTIQAGFDVLKDEEPSSAGGQESRSHSVVAPNVLKPRKALEDGFHEAIAIFEDPDPNVKPMYRKNEVYAGGKELQLEELHALDYFRKRADLERRTRVMTLPQQPDQMEVFQREASSTGGIEQFRSTRREQEPQHNPGEFHDFYGSRPVAIGGIQEPILKQPSFSGNSVMPSISSRGVTSTHCEAFTGNTASTASCPMNSFHEVQQLSPYSNLPVSEDRLMFGSNQLQHQQPLLGLKSQPPNQSFHNQSMTLHTKLAMHEVDNLWGSPYVLKPTVSQSSTSTGKSQPAFQIMRDDSLALAESPARNNDLSTFVGNNFHTSNHDLSYQPRTDDSLPHIVSLVADITAHNSSMIPSAPLKDHPVEDRKMDVYPAVSSHNVENLPETGLFEDPLTVTSYNQLLNGHQSFERASYSQDKAPTLSKKFEVFCDGTENNSIPTRTFSLEKGDLSSSVHTSSSSVQKIAKEKENIHKFPLADFELMEECGTTPAEISPLMAPQQPRLQYENQNPVYAPSQQTTAENFDPQHLQPIHTSSHPGVQEPMEDDATVAAGPQIGINMSETGITEAFFFPKFDAASTPFRDPSRKIRNSKSPIDFNSSVYRVEQTRPLECDDNFVDGSELSPGTPKTVPPLKLFRVKPDENQLSAILEMSKEKYSSVLSSGSSRSSISSGLTNSRYGMYTTQRQSTAPQLGLNLIHETSESSSQEGLGQVQDSKVMSELSMRLAKENIDPFDPRLLELFLSHMGFPLPHHVDGYFCLNAAVPAKRNNCLNLNGDVYNIAKTLGEGAYAKVLKGVHTITQQEVALKIQKPSCRWEYYICREIQERLAQKSLASAFMPAEQIYVFNNGSVIVTDLLPFGTLLNLVNKVFASTKRQMQELQVMFLISQLIKAVAALHECKIIHGDLKPDNILIRTIPSVHQETCIQLIDFGRSIDMKLMPSGTTFKRIVLTDSFTCIEMRTGRPWTYQTDLFGLANTAHCLLMGDYMKIHESKSTGRWAVQAKFPRHLNSEFWGSFFDTLLNIESCDVMPDLDTLHASAQALMNSQFNHLSTAVSALSRLLLER